MNKKAAERRSHIKKVLKDHFTPVSTILTSEFGLLRLDEPGITKSEANKILQEAAKITLASEILSAPLAQIHESCKLSTGCPRLDAFLGGGFAVRGITEIAGSSGCGKTQLCLQLLLTVQLPKDDGGFQAGAVYICTEDTFPSQRLQQLGQTFPKMPASKRSRFGDHIYIEHIADIDQILHCLQERLPLLLSQRKIGLIVLDSIAGIFRGTYSIETCLQRAETLRTVGGILHVLAMKHNIGIICINQVTANMTSASSNSTVPSLGLAWSNLVTTRLVMHRTDPACNFVVRTLEVLFSPYLPNRSINFVVSEDGVRGV